MTCPNDPSAHAPSPRTATQPPRFETLAQVLAEARVLGRDGYERRGQWSLGQACVHLAMMIEMSLDGFVFTVPWPMRVLGRAGRGLILRWGIPGGLKLRGASKVLQPPAEVVDHEGVERLATAIDRFEQAPTVTTPHPVLGPMDKAQWTRFHCRHAELHLGKLEPRGEG